MKSPGLNFFKFLSHVSMVYSLCMWWSMLGSGCLSGLHRGECVWVLLFVVVHFMLRVCREVMAFFAISEMYWWDSPWGAFMTLTRQWWWPCQYWCISITHFTSSIVLRLLSVCCFLFCTKWRSYSQEVKKTLISQSTGMLLVWSDIVVSTRFRQFYIEVSVMLTVLICCLLMHNT